MVILADEEVVGLQVPVNDAPLVRRRETLGDLKGVIHSLLLRNRTRVELAAQRLALQKLHDRVGCPLVGPEVEDREDVGMRQRRDRQSFALESRQGVWISAERLRQDLDRHIALQLRVPRPVHLSHPAHPDGREDFVGTEACSGWKCHPTWRETLHLGSSGIWRAEKAILAACLVRRL